MLLGSVHDWTAFKESHFGLNPGNYLDAGQYILGDSGYRLLGWILIPYGGVDLDSHENSEFNAWISSLRVVIEHVNGILKSRWSSLNGIRIQIKVKEHLKNVIEWIQCCCTYIFSSKMRIL